MDICQSFISLQKKRERSDFWRHPIRERNSAQESGGGEKRGEKGGEKGEGRKRRGEREERREKREERSSHIRSQTARPIGGLRRDQINFRSLANSTNRYCCGEDSAMKTRSYLVLFTVLSWLFSGPRYDN